MTTFDKEVRELTVDEIDLVSGGGSVIDGVPRSVKYIGIFGTGAMFGAAGGPIGAAAGGVAAVALAYLGGV